MDTASTRGRRWQDAGQGSVEDMSGLAVALGGPGPGPGHPRTHPDRPGQACTRTHTWTCLLYTSPSPRD
eukprot:83089-Alexandrium_andersonii.AAC.1